jgi:hypothetical protein
MDGRSGARAGTGPPARRFDGAGVRRGMESLVASVALVAFPNRT